MSRFTAAALLFCTLIWPAEQAECYPTCLPKWEPCFQSWRPPGGGGHLPACQVHAAIPRPCPYWPLTTPTSEASCSCSRSRMSDWLLLANSRQICVESESSSMMQRITCRGNASTRVWEGAAWPGENATFDVDASRMH